MKPITSWWGHYGKQLKENNMWPFKKNNSYIKDGSIVYEYKWVHRKDWDGLNLTNG